jgi:hypothetical protein
LLSFEHFAQAFVDRFGLRFRNDLCPHTGLAILLEHLLGVLVRGCVCVVGDVANRIGRDREGARQKLDRHAALRERIDRNALGVRQFALPRRQPDAGKQVFV